MTAEGISLLQDLRHQLARPASPDPTPPEATHPPTRPRLSEPSPNLITKPSRRLSTCTGHGTPPTFPGLPSCEPGLWKE